MNIKFGPEAQLNGTSLQLTIVSILTTIVCSLLCAVIVAYPDDTSGFKCNKTARIVETAESFDCPINFWFDPVRLISTYVNLVKNCL